MLETIVQAGDTTQTLLMAGLMIASALIIVIFLIAKLIKINKK